MLIYKWFMRSYQKYQDCFRLNHRSVKEKFYTIGNFSVSGLEKLATVHMLLNKELMMKH